MKMVKVFKRIGAIALAFVMVVAFAPLKNLPVKANNIASGTWGTCPWVIDENGVLTVSPGTGENNGYHSPWGAYANNVTSVVFETGANGSKVIAPADSKYLFYMMERITSIDLRGMDASNVTTIANMFNKCYALKSVNFTGVNAPLVTNASVLFEGCEELETLTGFEDMNLSAVNNIWYIFKGCSSLETIDLSCMSGASIRGTCESSFEDCSAVTEINLSGIDTSQMDNARYMFKNCSLLTTIYVDEGWSVEGMRGDDEDSPQEQIETLEYCSNYMFTGCTSLVGGAGTPYTVGHVNYEYARIDGGPESATPGYFTYRQAAVPVQEEPVIEQEPQSPPQVVVTRISVPTGKNFTYNGKTQTGVKAGTGYTLSGTVSAKNAGTYTAKATLKNGYAWSNGSTGVKKISWKISKAKNPLTVKGKKISLKVSKVKNKKQIFAVSRVLTVKKNQGKVSYKKVSGNKNILIDKKTGKVTVNKGTKKGTYKIKVNVSAAGNGNYNSITKKNVAFKIVIK